MSSNKEYFYDVIVIGAGAAGIGAAVNLSRNHFSYVALEARERLGGRVHAKEIDGIQIDVGASWIHDYDEYNPMKESMDAYQITEAKQAKNPRVMFDGFLRKTYDQITISQGFDTFQKFRKRAKENQNKAEEINSLKEAIERLIFQEKMQMDPSFQRLIQLINNLTQTQGVSYMKRLSIGHFDYQTDKGRNILPEPTYGGFLKKIALDNKINVHFNRVVEKVVYSKGRVAVWCQDGSFYTGKSLVCGVPVGVLQSDSIKFTPSLPKKYVESFSKIRLTPLRKVIVSFESNFWGSASWINISSCEVNQFSKICDFSKQGRHILCCFLTEEEEKKCENLTEKELLEELLVFLGKAYKVENMKVRDYIVASWAKEEFCPATADVENIVNQIREPISSKIWFAGECCNGEYFGTVHGALKSGLRASQQIIELLKKSNETGFSKL